MIYLDVVGRCGNQMFQYAFARKLSLLNNDKITIDFNKVYKYGKEINDKTFCDELKNFKASEVYQTINDDCNKIYKYGSRRQVFIFKVYTKLKRFLQKFSSDKRLANKFMYRIMCKSGIYWYIAPEKIKKCKEKNKFVFGFFENPAYFDDIKEYLYDEFKPNFEEKEKNSEMYNQIRNSESVCISFRKWCSNEFVTSEREVCDQKYYEKAIEKIKTIIPNARYVVFSNDVNWVKENFNLPENSIYEDGTDEVWEKIRLMYICKHFIVANSTFCWWAQYLGQDKNKIVVSPDRWLNNEKDINPLITENFIKI